MHICMKKVAANYSHKSTDADGSIIDLVHSSDSTVQDLNVSVLPL